MADQDQAAAAVEDRGQRWQSTLDPAVVGDAAVGRLRNVEIDADQDLFAGHVDVAERLFRHECFPARQIGGIESERGRAGSACALLVRLASACTYTQSEPSLVISSAVRLE